MNEDDLDFSKEMEERLQKLQDEIFMNGASASGTGDFNPGINNNDHSIGTGWGDPFGVDKYTSPNTPYYPNLPTYPNMPQQPYPTSPNTIGYPNTDTGTFTKTDSNLPLIIKALAEISERLNKLDERVGILQSAPDDKVKALQEAYEHYKFIEKLCQGDDNDRNIEEE